MQERKQQKERDKSKKGKDSGTQEAGLIGGELGLDDLDLLPEDDPAEQGLEEQRPSSQGPLPNGPEAGPEPSFDLPEHLQV